MLLGNTLLGQTALGMIEDNPVIIYLPLSKIGSFSSFNPNPTPVTTISSGGGGVFALVDDDNNLLTDDNDIQLTDDNG